MDKHSCTCKVKCGSGHSSLIAVEEIRGPARTGVIHRKEAKDL